MITKEEFLSLYEKDVCGKCTADEKKLLDAHRDEMVFPDDNWEPGLGDEKEIYKRIRQRLGQSMNSRTFSGSSRGLGWLKVAAVILAISSTALLLWNIQQSGTKNQPVIAKHIRPAIHPGSNKAYLTMANGAVIILNDSKNGKLATQSGVQISKAKDGMLVYHQDAEQLLSAETALNMITTPRGGQYQVVLSDGTKVWLNSASSLKYPPVFSGKERKVELTGEGYFEVAKNAAMPFKVAVNGIDIQVLGTHFNVMAYTDEKAVKTTLLEGAVKLSNGSHAAFLKPGEQGILNEQQTSFNVKDVNVENEIAWKNGFFAFDDESIQTIMKEISRWYDVDVVFNEKIVRRNFGGTVSRFKDVAEVLRALELTGSVHFKVEGRRIVVMP
ncbi:MAG: FecR family protein [Sphingobacteriales bacterium]|nr:FecR family protein [Sphingobacteriales bacterium]